jgi:cytoskeleton-associated protein 5
VIAPAIVGQLGDSLEPVRSAAAEGLGALSKIFGERPMNPYLENITDAQRTKINEAMATSVVQCKAGGAPPPPKPAPAAAVPKAKMPARLAARLATKPAEDVPEDEAPKAKAAAPVEAATSRAPSSASVSRPPSTAPASQDIGSDIAAPTPVKKAGPPARLMARAPPPVSLRGR